MRAPKSASRRRHRHGYISPPTPNRPTPAHILTSPRTLPEAADALLRALAQAEQLATQTGDPIPANAAAPVRRWALRRLTIRACDGCGTPALAPICTTCLTPLLDADDLTAIVPAGEEVA